jgi:hypothetical protein
MPWFHGRIVPKAKVQPVFQFCHVLCSEAPRSGFAASVGLRTILASQTYA